MKIPRRLFLAALGAAGTGLVLPRRTRAAVLRVFLSARFAFGSPTVSR
jgi:hypothetical protein